ncbi:MAG: hypothetical protein WDM81_20515 [Rhizomicrobium sp.]
MGTVNITPEGDALRARLASTMTVFNRGSFAVSVPQQGGPALFFAYMDSRDARFASSLHGMRTYTFFALDEIAIDANTTPTCQVENGIALFGTANEAKLIGQQVSVDTIVVRRDDPILQKICSSLSRPMSWLTGSEAKSDRTVYDYLTNNHGNALVLWLQPDMTPSGAKRDVTTERTYWGEAILSEYLGTPFTDPHQAPDDDMRDAALQFENSGTAKLSRQVPLGFSGVDFPNPYPTEMLKQYDGRIQAMDAKWLRFLKSSAVTLHGATHNIWEHDNFQPIVSTYSVSQIDTPDFWLHASDVIDFSVQLDCIAARFAVENGYSKAVDLPAFGHCPLWQIQRSVQ